MEMVKIRRFSAIGLGLALITTILTPAQAASKLTLADVYNPSKIVRADLTLPEDSIASLNNPETFTVYVPGTLALSLDGKSSGNLSVKLRLKGSTSMYSLAETPSFKIKFPNKEFPFGYLGLKRMTFNGLVQDTSKLHEYGAYALFNAMGLPAPKTGWLRLYINGVDRGLFINVEQPDQTFMEKRFKDITQHIYEGIADKDFRMGNDTGDDKTGYFLVDYGWKATPNKRDLTKAINYNADWEYKTWYPGLNAVFDRTQMIKFFAVENYLGHWDGYSGPDVNNYYIRSNTRGKFSFIPWGTDQTFGENRGTDKLGDDWKTSMLSQSAAQPWSKTKPRGMIYTKCISYKPCRTEYLNDLKAVAAMVTSMKLTTKMKAAANLINPVLTATTPKDPIGIAGIKVEQTRTYNFITKRQLEVAALLKSNGIK